MRGFQVRRQTKYSVPLVYKMVHKNKYFLLVTNLKFHIRGPHILKRGGGVEGLNAFSQSSETTIINHFKKRTYTSLNKANVSLKSLSEALC